MEFYLFATASTSALRPAQPPIQWVKRREAVHSPPSTIEVRMCVAIREHLHTFSWRGAYLSTGTALHLQQHCADITPRDF